MLEVRAEWYVKHTDVVAFCGQWFGSWILGRDVGFGGQVHFLQVLQVVQKRFDSWNVKNSTVLGGWCSKQYIPIRPIAIFIHVHHGRISTWRGERFS